VDLRRFRLAFAMMVVAGCSAAAPTPAPDPAFEARWRDGRAELDAYRLTIQRYGAPRIGQAMLVYVTEPFSARDRVKIDDPAQHAGDVLDVLKLNVARDFQTGIYDYNTMVSTFVRVADLAPVKVSFSSTEWCGNVYEEMRIDPGRIAQTVHSYFEGESGERTLERPANGVLEDELFVRVRGLHGDWLKAGEKRRVPFLEGALWRRLAHRHAEWTKATIERLATTSRVTVPAGTFATIRYVVTIEGGRRGDFDVERDDPHRVVDWEWSAPSGERGRALGGTDRGELAGSRRLPYWRLNGPGDEKYLDSLGVKPILGGR
jgi:hypothetical protein